MGKCMKKSKITSDVAVIVGLNSLSPQCSLGVRTRAKTLALERQQENQKSQSFADESSFSYLELRSHRLEKPTLLGDAKKTQAHGRGGRRNPPQTEDHCEGVGNPCPNVSWSDSRFGVRPMESVDSVDWKGDDEKDQDDAVLEVSFGENNLDFGARDRSTRESTPCSFTREPDTLTAPGSTTRRTSSTATNRRVRNIPTAHEMEEFFAVAEQQQQRMFIEKYNFDIASDSPLPGRYEWVQAMP